MTLKRKFAILTEGRSDPHNAKTATSVLRYRGHEVVALLDSTEAGKTAGELLGVGDATPVKALLSEAPDADTLLIGTASAGGVFDESWRPVILEALSRGMDIISGMHVFLSDDDAFRAAAQTSGAELIDLRKNNETTIAKRLGLSDQSLRIHTVGNDCSVGKMAASIEVSRGLQRLNRDACFVATGQTGILIAGNGCPIDCVTADFINGAAEKLVLDRAEHEILLIEGQGSLVHPSYSSVTLGLLHGCAPHGLIFCYEVGRTHVARLEHVPIPSLRECVSLYETMAGIRSPCPVVGFALNGRKVSPEQGEAERLRVEAEFGLPACDVFRDGPDALVQAVLRFETTSKV